MSNIINCLKWAVIGFGFLLGLLAPLERTFYCESWSDEDGVAAFAKHCGCVNDTPTMLHWFERPAGTLQMEFIEATRDDITPGLFVVKFVLHYRAWGGWNGQQTDLEFVFDSLRDVKELE